ERATREHPPIATLATLTTRVGAITEEISGRVLLAGSAILVLERGFDEGCEQRVRLPRPRAELGVELAGDEEGVVRQLDDLHELLLGPDARNAKPSLLERVEVVVVHLVAVAMPLADRALPVDSGGGAALLQHD